MEKTLEKGEDKVQKICDLLRKDTLEPARTEAARIINEAKARAEQILQDAHSQAARVCEDAKIRIENERNVLHASLRQASVQVLSQLRNMVEHGFFTAGLQELISNESVKPKLIAQLISAMVGAIEKDGLSADFSALVPTLANTDEINDLLSASILKKLKEKSVVLSSFSGGVQLKLHDKKMTLDMTDKTLLELLLSHVRKDFHKFFSHS